MFRVSKVPRRRAAIAPLAGLLFVAGVVNAGAAALAPGNWGGRGARVAIEDGRMRLDLDCGQAIFAGPVRLDHAGRFTLDGRYEAYTPGPQAGDATPSTRPVRVTGKVAGDALMLDARLPGESTARHFQLTRGRAVKLIRCL